LAARAEIESVAYGSCAPVQAGCNRTTARFPDRPPAPPGNNPVVGVVWASPTYFDTLGVQLVRGRTFTDLDRVGQPKVVVVNATAARQLWPGEDPVGKRIALGQGGFGDGAEVVGVVADVRYVRSRISAATAVGLVRGEMKTLDPDLPLTDIRMMEERASEATWRTRMSAWLLVAFATLALVLVALGVYGVVSQSVQHRTREIGVRLAMGAVSRDILRLIIGRVLAIAAAGIVLGLALAVPAMKLLTTLLYQVEPGDPWVSLPLAFVLLAVAVLAAYVPARRATRLDPLTTLRAE
jgi:putative ABC transport system permease protein